MVRRLFYFLLVFFATKDLVANEVLFLTEQYPPYVFEERGELKGLSTQVVREAIHLAGMDAEIKVYPFARTIRLAKNEEPVIAYPLIRTPERDVVFNWLGPVAKDSIHLYKLRERVSIRVEDFDDLKDLSISSIRGGAIESYFKKALVNNLETVTDIEQGIRMLKAGNVDLLAMPKLTMTYFSKKNHLSGTLLEPVFHVESLDVEAQLAASKSVPNNIVNKLRDALAYLHSSGRFDEIQARAIQRYQD